MKNILLIFSIFILAISCVSVPQTESKETQAPPPVTTQTSSYLREADRGSIILPGIFFERGKSTLSGEYKRSLNVLKNVMSSNTNITVIIEGHASVDGKAYPNNYELSKKRAETVYNYIVNTMKLPKSKFTLKYYGEALPEHPEPRLHLNRRVQFIIIKDQADLDKYNIYTKDVDIKKER